MDKAFCTIDNKEWDARLFSTLSDSDLLAKRRSLLCPGCRGDAWFRKSSYGNESPHFCAHHLEECVFGTVYEAVGEGEGDKKIPDSDSDSGIILDLGSAKNSDIDVVATEEKPESGIFGQRLREGAMVTGGQKYPERATLKQILLRLVKSDGQFFADKYFSTSGENLKGLPEAGSELFVQFSDVPHRDEQKNDGKEPWIDGARRIFWGFISDAGQTRDGKIWLNAGNIRAGLSVCLPEGVTASFRERFRIGDNLDALDGCHALVIGTCTYAVSGKPVIRCNDLNHIVLRRYKAD